MHKIPFKFAINAMLILLFLVVVFHLFVITGILPYNIVWGGKFQSPEEMRRLEVVSILINVLIGTFIAIKGAYIKINIPTKILNFIIWLFVLLFLLNTIGNLFAETMTEKLIFTPLTFISAILCFRIAINKED